MRKHALVLGLTFLGLAAFAVFAGWTFFSSSNLSDGWRSLGPLWPYVAGGLVIASALAGLLFWLAFYAARHRFEDDKDR